MKTRILAGLRAVWLVAPDLLFFLTLLVMSFGFWLAWAPLGPIAFGATICLPMLFDRMFRGGPRA